MAIYMATHVADSIPPFDYIIPIFVGNIAKIKAPTYITDRTDNHISERNHVYSELTALYWIWKNTQDDIVGLCHYRRFFDINEIEIQNIVSQNKIILPLAYKLKWQVDQQFILVHNEKIWKKTLAILYNQYPQYIAMSKQVFSDNLLFQHNMFIAGRAFVENYCTFLFDILFELEKAVDMQHEYEQRYAGFVAERLLTLYIIGNNISRIEKPIINASGKHISPSPLQQILNHLHFRMFKK